VSGGYFAVVPETVLYSTLSDKAIRVYAVLARHADKTTGKCFPSRARIAELARCSLRSVDRALAELVAARVIQLEHRLNAAGDPATNLYTIRPFRGDDMGDRTPTGDATGRQDCHQGGDTDDATGSDTADALNQSHCYLEPIDERETPALEVVEAEEKIDVESVDHSESVSRELVVIEEEVALVGPWSDAQVDRLYRVLRANNHRPESRLIELEHECGVEVKAARFTGFAPAVIDQAIEDCEASGAQWPSDFKRLLPQLGKLGALFSLVRDAREHGDVPEDDPIACRLAHAYPGYGYSRWKESVDKLRGWNIGNVLIDQAAGITIQNGAAGPGFFESVARNKFAGTGNAYAAR
jgi:hypothetical protein